MFDDSETFNLALQHLSAQQYTQAEALFREFLDHEPDHAMALHLWGRSLALAGRWAEAIEPLTQAIDRDSSNAWFYNGLAEAHLCLGQYQEAVFVYQEMLRRDPTLLIGYLNLGVALTGLKEWQQAQKFFQEALRVDPNLAAGHLGLGVCLQNHGQILEAIAAYQTTIRLDPNSLTAHVNLANYYFNAQHWPQAISAYQEVIRLDPQSVFAHAQLALCLMNTDRLEQAILAKTKAIGLDPDVAIYHANLGSLLISLGRIEEGIKFYQRAALCPDVTAKSSSFAALSTLWDMRLSHAEIYQAHVRWAERFAAPLSRSIRPHINDPSPTRRLRIGYINPHYSAFGFFLEPVLAHHDHERLEIFVYGYDGITSEGESGIQRFQSYADHWHRIEPITLDADLAERIRADQIDILIDVQGQANDRLLVFAHKPAPIQVVYPGHVATTGLKQMDYRISDIWLDPVGLSEAYFTETLVRLPEGYCVYRPEQNAPAVGPLPCLKADFISFCCSTNLLKISSLTIALWAQVLQAVPGSQMLIKAPELHRSEVQKGFYRCFEEHGIGPERIQLLGHVPFAQRYDFYQQVDIGLDTFPHNGMTSLCETLWMGIPVVSLAGLPGSRSVSRMGLSLLTRIGIPELVAGSEAEFVQIAAQLAQDRERLQALRLSLRQRMQASPLTDGPAFTRSLEAAYRQMWMRWCAQTNARSTI